MVNALKLVTFILAFISAFEARAQNLQWQTIYGNPGEFYNDQAYNCIQSADGSFLATGRWEIPIEEWPYTLLKAFVSRLDSSGNVLWTKLIGDSSFSNLALTLAEDPGGNIYVAHYSEYAHLAKLDADGNLLWDKEYSSNEILLFRGISFQNDFRNIVLLGLNYGTQFDWTASVTKLDSNGHLLWNKAIYDTFPSLRTYVCYNNSFCFTESGYYVTGYTGNYEPYVLKLDTSGNMIWNNRYHGSKTILSIDTITSQSLVASGTMLPGLRLIKIDSSGNEYWSKSYSGDTSAAYIYADKILSIPGNKFVLGATRGSYSGRLMIIDSSGVVLASKVYNFSMTYTVEQRNVFFCSDSGFVFSGVIRNWYDGIESEKKSHYEGLQVIQGDKDKDILIFKTDKAFNTTSISNNSAIQELSVNVLTFPNPANGNIKVRINSEISALAILELTDISGRRVIVYISQIVNAGTNELLLSTDRLSSGVYFLSTKIGNREIRSKIVILK